MRLTRATLAAATPILSFMMFAALTAAASASTAAGGYTGDPSNGDILGQLGFQSGINLSTIASTVAGPVAFITFMGGALQAAQRINQSQGHWHELIHSGATTGFMGLTLGGAGLYWSKTHAASGALIPHAASAIHHLHHILR